MKTKQMDWILKPQWHYEIVDAYAKYNKILL